MNNEESITRLRQLQTESDAIRNSLGISAPGSVIYLAEFDVCSERKVVVEADGFGGASVRVVEGNYPIDYIALYEKQFTNEDEAVSAAETTTEWRTEDEAALG